MLHTHAAALQRADHVSWIQTQESATLPAVVALGDSMCIRVSSIAAIQRCCEANVKIAASSVPFARVSDLVEVCFGVARLYLFFSDRMQI